MAHGIEVNSDSPNPGTETVPDALLFQRIARGETDAFAEFYDRHATLLYSVAFRIVGQEKEAEDVVQDGCILLWQRAPTFDPALGNPLSWAIAIIRNKAIDRVRSTRRRAELIAEILSNAETSTSTSSLDSGDGGGDTSRFVRKAMDALGSEQRKAIELAFFAGLTQTEIATQLQQPLGTIKARIRRGLLTLRDALEGIL